MARLPKPKAGQTKREWLAALNPPLAKSGARGRFSAEANAALSKASERGYEFAEPERPTSAPVTSEARKRSHDIREWAGEQGIAVPDRGRIPNEVHNAYNSRG